ncbi:GNAT family N-acetyltransferase [Thermocoleostomius sinensis]|uniref:GNAT family N-acetyltransferase n=1 Tax=Thermocoleostomius sinensis A174 TaxID=2016057 RepID=A0A9E8ZBZ7_9CYAN|nr:GNAT family N-acetyltransferase [Thermocoleostomius sinensis]WAL58470.1 GNAT family N-acetyltransferase [Thermocoleostomius sinensis A174]
MITIRQATVSDLADILALYRQPALDDNATLSMPQAEEQFARIQTYPNYHLYVAEFNGAVVGTFALLIMDNLLHLGRPSGIIEAVAVALSHQGQGIGKAMMQVAMEQCRQANCYKLTLSSNLKRSSAHAFYESLGFVKHGFSFVVDLTP